MWQSCPAQKEDPAGVCLPGFTELKMEKCNSLQGDGVGSWHRSLNLQVPSATDNKHTVPQQTLPRRKPHPTALILPVAGLANHPHANLCEVMWSVGAQICRFRDSRTHTFPVEPTSLSPTCPFLLTGVQIMFPPQRVPASGPPSWSPHLTNRDSNLSLRLHLSHNSDSSAQ